MHCMIGLITCFPDITCFFSKCNFPLKVNVKFLLCFSLVHNSFGYYIADAIPFVSTPFLTQLLSIFLSSFLSKLGMIHSLTCPHTHHQNEVVEIKHHDIVEFGFSLRSQPYASLPLSFWDHAFETTVYLINRLP